MGTHDANPAGNAEVQQRAMRLILRDLDALERMIREGLFETSPRRIGAEQEMLLIDQSLRPAPVGMEVIEQVGDARVVPELARFNVEFNCDPIEIGPDCLDRLEMDVSALCELVAEAAAKKGASALLTGIGPTVDLSDLSTSNIAPRARYASLDEALRLQRGNDFALHIEGADELTVRHPSVMLEALNTSFQVHFQTTPDEFVAAYNTALATAGPLLAACVNSPILFGKRLWGETRIAIFQQVVDTRRGGAGARDFPGRVRFGESWAKESVLEIFRRDVARFRQVLTAAEEEGDEDPMVALNEGRAPKLRSLQAFNSCVYCWMRPCYGRTDGRPHLRIENRVLPAGPTIADEVANAAFWIGLMAEGPHAWPEIDRKLDFRDARANFLRAAEHGLSCHLAWLGGVERPVRELLEEEFIPVAKLGLKRLTIDASSIDRWMSILIDRVQSGRTGARWMLDSVSRLHGWGTRAQRLDCLTRAMLRNQESGEPVHRWEIADHDGDDGIGRAFSTVSQCMTTDLFTVSETECVDLVASIMNWERLRHIPVENSEHQLVGLISYRDLLRVLVSRYREVLSGGGHPLSAADVMKRDPLTVTPDTPSIDAIRLMHERGISCLPVLEDGRLVGIISERDFSAISRSLLERALTEGVGDKGKAGGNSAPGDT